VGFQVSIDGGAQTQFQIDGNANDDIAYNFSAYNIQSLQSGNHTLDLILLNATGSNSYFNYAIFDFNYAVVNETDAFPTQVTSSTSTPSTAAAHTPTASTAAPPSPAPSTAQ
jgi:hypothetical protein